MENNKLEKVTNKNHLCYYFDGIFKFEDFDFYILIDEKSFDIIICF